MKLAIRRRQLSRTRSRGVTRHILLLALLLAGCTPASFVPSTDEPTSPPIQSTDAPAVVTATPPEDTPIPGTRRYRNSDLGITLRYPAAWTPQSGEQDTTLTWLTAPSKKVSAVLFYGSMPSGMTLEQAARQVRESTAS